MSAALLRAKRRRGRTEAAAAGRQQQHPRRRSQPQCLVLYSKTRKNGSCRNLMFRIRKKKLGKYRVPRHFLHIIRSWYLRTVDNCLRTFQYFLNYSFFPVLTVLGTRSIPSSCFFSLFPLQTTTGGRTRPHCAGQGPGAKPKKRRQKRRRSVAPPPVRLLQQHRRPPPQLFQFSVLP